jgi:hypothetical protein
MSRHENNVLDSATVRSPVCLHYVPVLTYFFAEKHFLLCMLLTLLTQRLTYLLQEAGQARASAFAAEALQAGQEGAAVQGQCDLTEPPLEAEALVQEVLDAL